MYDVVCGMKVDGRINFKSLYNKKAYGFCSKNCKSEFEKTPKKFVNEVPVIELQEVHKDFEMGSVTVPVLRGLSLRVWKNDFVALMGASGSGKTTAMNIIGVLDTATSGKVYIDGTEVSNMTEDQLAKIRSKKIGFVFQQFNLLAALDCQENVSLPLFFRDKLENTGDRKRINSYIDSVGLKDRKAHKPLEMSGGEQQRVAIARALVNSPELVIADEPTGNLDSVSGKLIIEILKNLNKQGTTIVVVTHDLNIAKEAKRVLHMKDGKLITPED